MMESSKLMKPNNHLSILTKSKVIVDVAPIITRDNKYVICACHSDVLIFHRRTGVKEHTFRKHTNDVLNIFRDPADPLQIISCSKSALYKWDFTDLRVSKCITFKDPIFHLELNPKDNDVIYYTKNRKGKKKQQRELYRNTLSNFNNETALGVISKTTKCCSISENGKYVLFYYKNKLNAYCEKSNIKNKYSANDNLFTSVSVHYKNNIVATGDITGKILIWYELLRENGEVTQRVLHWHPTPVNDIAFTTDGDYLLSGGNESVLVVWQIESGKKSFVPRLGGAIKHLFLSQDGQYMGLTLGSNIIKVLSVLDYKLSSSIKSLCKGSSIDAGLTYHKKLECICLNGYPGGVVQFYHPVQDSVKLSLDIIGENYIPSLPERSVYPTTIQKIAFTEDGSWMATVEIREDRILPAEQKLKIWEYSEQQKNFSISAVIDPPHEDDVINLFFRTSDMESMSDCMLYTASKDGCMKSWIVTIQEAVVKRKKKRIKNWQMHSIVKYGKDTLKSAVCSSDGSIVAALFAHVTLWNAETLTHETNLPCHSIRDEIKDIVFARKESSHYLLGRSTNSLVVWDLDMLQMKWQLELNVTLLLADPYSKYVAIFIQKGKNKVVLMFDPSSPEPCDIYPLKDCADNIISAIFTPREERLKADSFTWASVGRLHFLTESKELKSIVMKDDNIQEKSSTLLINDDQSSTYQDIFGIKKEVQKTGSMLEERTNIPIGNPTSQFIRELMSVSATVLPATDILCKGLLRTLVVQKTSSQSSNDGLGAESSADSCESGETSEDEEEKNSERDSDEDDNIKEKSVKETDNIINEVKIAKANNKRTKLELKNFDLDFELGAFNT